MEHIDPIEKPSESRSNCHPARSDSLNSPYSELNGKMISFSISQLALPGVSLLIALLAYGSQVLFQYIEPSPLDQRQKIIFNSLVGCIWICYARACYTDPGHVPPGWIPSLQENTPSGTEESSRRQRWCRRCESLKPPRTHHCKVCQRYCLLKFYVSQTIVLCLI